MDEKFLDYMTKTEYASEYPGVVKNAEHADSATGSQFADNAIKLGGNESTYYASAATMNEVLKTANGAQSTATAAQTLASEAKLDAAAAKSAADNAQATANACIPKNDITEVTGEFTTKVMSQKATTEQLNLCMKKADYDSDGDVVVERADEAIRAESAALADNALKLNEKAEAELSVASSENATKLGNKLESELNVAHSINADTAARLGEYGPDYFASKSDFDLALHYKENLIGTSFDLNQFFSADKVGIYQIANATNAPVTYGTLIVTYANGYSTQIVIQAGTAMMFVRSKNDTGAISAWSRLITSGTSLSGQNLNNANIAGSYGVFNGTIAQGAPYDAAWGTLLVQTAFPYVTQLFMNVSGGMQIRSFNGTSWSAWNKIC